MERIRLYFVDDDRLWINTCLGENSKTTNR